MIHQPLAIVAVLLGAIFISVRLTARYAWARRLSSAIWIIFTCALASNLGLIPTDAPLYGALIGFTVPFAVCVILFTVRLSDVRDAGAPMLAAFVLASVGTVIGVVVASVALEPLLSRILEGEAWKLAGPYTGTYVGGSLNFFALWTALEIDNPDLLAAANAVDNLTIFPLYTAWMLIPAALAGSWVTSSRWAASRDEAAAEAAGPAADDAGTAADPGTGEKPPLDTADIATLVFLAVLVLAVSDAFQASVLARFAPGVPTILVVTTLALAVAQLGPVRRLDGAWEIGDLAFYVFFAAVGAMIDFYQAVALSPALFLYVAIIMAVHMTWLYGVGRLARLDLGVLTIASVATKAGPPLVVPVAEAKGWKHLVLPGIIVGMLGYAVGNYIGWAVASVVRTLLG